MSILSILPPFGSPGGKYKNRAEIVATFPEHRVFVEPYAGSAAILYCKEISEIEIINDLDKEIAFAHRFIKHVTREQIEELRKRNWTSSRALFERLRDSKPENDIDRIYRFLYLKHASYGGVCNSKASYAPTQKGKFMGTCLDRLQLAALRLNGVEILCKPALEVIKEYDCEDALFYLDPPYEEDWKPHLGVDKFDIEDLVDILKSLEGKFILSYEDKKKARELLREFCIRKLKFTRFFQLSSAKEYVDYELLAANFELPSRINKAIIDDFLETLQLPSGFKEEFEDYIAAHNIYDRDSGELAMLPNAELQRLYDNWIKELKDKKRSFFVPIDGDVEKGVRQLFGMPGGKRRLAHIIASIISEQEHKTYVEPFAGGAAVLFVKSPSEREVLADINEDIIFAYEFVKNITDKQIEELKRKKWKIEEKYFYELRDSETPKDDIERFYRWIYLKRGSFGAGRGAKKKGVKDWVVNQGAIGTRRNIHVVNQLPIIKERLQNVILEKADYRTTIKKYDDDDTLFYLDPPYFGEEVDGTQIDNLDFYDAVKAIKGKWLVSINDLPENRESFKDYNICTVHIGRRMDSGGEKGAMRTTELLIANFDLPEKIIKIAGEKLDTGEEKLTREEERQLLEEEIGDYYIVCLDGSSQVTALTENKTINKIEEGEMVLSHDGKFHKVVRTFNRRYSGRFFTIRVRGHFDAIQCTAEHPIYAIREPHSESSSRNSPFAIGKSLLENHYLFWYPGIGNIRTLKCDWIKAEDLRENDYLISKYDTRIIPINEIELPKVKKHSNKKDWPKSACVDKDFLGLIGAFLAEGSVCKGMVEFALHVDKDVELKEFIIREMKRTFGNISYRERLESDFGIRIRFCSTQAERFFRQFYASNKEKTLPEWVKTLNVDKQSSLLFRFWQGDGSLDANHLIFSSAHESLITGIYLLLLRLGCLPTINKFETSTNYSKHAICYIVTLASGYGAKRILALWGLKSDLLSPIAHNFLGWNDKAGTIIRKIANIDEEQVENKVVWNLEVEESNSFNLSAASVHNCQPPDKQFDFVIQYHVRGIWSKKDVKQIREGLKEAKDQKDLEIIWRENDCVYLKSSLEELSKDVQKVDDERGDVTKAAHKHLDDKPPVLSELDISRVYNLGNIHVDWRNMAPNEKYLIGMTNDSTKIVLQNLDDELYFPLRDRVLENQPGDNWLSEKKGSQPCVHGMTPVFTSLGLRPAKSLSPGDLILTKDGRFRELVGIRKIEGSSRRYRIRTQFGVDVWLTGEHPLYTKNGWIRAADIKPNDKVFFPRLTNLDLTNMPTSITLKTPSNYSKEIEVNEDFAEFLGYFAGDGSLGGQNKGGSPSKVMIWLGPTEQEKANRLVSIIENVFKVRPNVHKYSKPEDKRNIIIVSFTDRPLVNWLSKNCYLESDHRIKKLPDWAIFANEHILNGFIKGLVGSDGCILKNGRMMQFSNVSWQLSGQLIMMLLILKKVPRVRLIRSNNYSRNKNRVLKVKQNRSIWDLRWWIEEPKGIENLEDKTKDLLSDEEGWWFRVKSVSSEYRNQPVFDLQIAEDETFCVPFMATHNTAWLTLVSPKKPVWEAEPKRVGATRKTAGRFILKAMGKVIYGTRKSDFGEYFYKFDKVYERNSQKLRPKNEIDKLSGRWDWKLIPSRKEYSKAPEKQFWMGSRPWKTQKPYITTHNREIEERKAKRDKIEMIWNEDALKALEKFDFPIEFEKGFRIPILKLIPEKQIAIGPLLVPNRKDLQNDIVLPEDIEEAAHRSMIEDSEVHVMHDNKKINAVRVESYIYRKFDNVPEGTWIGAVKIYDKRVWEKVKNGEYRGFSIGGTGTRHKVLKDEEYGEDIE
jgi:DNA adenine methylase Dam